MKIYIKDISLHHYISPIAEEGLVYDYLFTSEKESHSVPDIDFVLYLHLFFPIWSYRE